MAQEFMSYHCTKCNCKCSETVHSQWLLFLDQIRVARNRRQREPKWRGRVQLGEFFCGHCDRVTRFAIGVPTKHCRKKFPPTDCLPCL